MEYKNFHLRKSSIYTFNTLILFLIFTSNSTVLADVDLNEIHTIDMNGYYPIQLNDVETGDLINIDIQVTSESPIDVFLLDEINYNRYLNGGIISIVEGSYSTNVMSVKNSLVVDKSGDYYLILYNTNTYGKTDPTGTVDIHATITVDSDNQILSISTSMPSPTATSSLTATSGPIATSSPIATLPITSDTSPTPKDSGLEIYLTVFAFLLALFLIKR